LQKFFNEITILITTVTMMYENDVYLWIGELLIHSLFFLEFCNSQILNIFVLDYSFASESITISAKEVQTKCLKVTNF